MTSNARVYVRIRPPNERERQLSSFYTCVSRVDDHSLLFKDDKEGEFYFSFDKCYYEDSSQEEIFECLALPIVKDAINAINGTILTYGQTGAGKTYSLEGPTILSLEKQRKGILPRVAESIFQLIKNAETSTKFTINLSMVEIYMEKIRDLFDLSKDNLQVKENRVKGVFISGVTEIHIQSVQEMLKHLSEGIANRAIGETQMNFSSSRSHCAFLITIQHENTEDQSIKTGKLFLVDLAGSEKIEKTGAERKLLEEAKTINKSLSALGNVINSLTSEKPSHIPYRDSKLTRILQESLGGNSKMALLCCCSPSSSNASESLSTLRFGARAKQIKSKPKVNAERSPRDLDQLVNKYAQQCEELRGEVAMLNARLQTVEKGESPVSTCKSVYNECVQKLKQGLSKSASKIEVEQIINLFKHLFVEESMISDFNETDVEDEVSHENEETINVMLKSLRQSFEELSRKMEMLKEENEALKSQLCIICSLRLKASPGKASTLLPKCESGVQSKTDKMYSPENRTNHRGYSFGKPFTDLLFRK